MQHLFLDESGDHGLASIDAAYPVFVLGGVIVPDDESLSRIDAGVRAFKVDVLGDDRLVLHTADIARNRKGFEGLARPDARARFHARLNELMADLPFSIVACAIRKPELLRRYGALALDPYLLSLGLVVERFCFALGGRGETGRILVERRNERLDRELRVAWDLLRLHGTRYVRPGTIARRISSLEFRRKTDREVGLELADLVVTPLGRWVAGMPGKPDLKVVRAKLRTRPDGSWEGAGLIVLPKEKGRGPLRNTRPPSE